jgi:hypothetical protein
VGRGMVEFEQKKGKTMKILLALFPAFWCASIHRNQEVVRTKTGKDIVICRTCHERGRKNEAKSRILTFYYLNNGLLPILMILPLYPFFFVSQRLTGRPALFEHPPEHRIRRWAWFDE